MISQILGSQHTYFRRSGHNVNKACGQAICLTIFYLTLLNNWKYHRVKLVSSMHRGAILFQFARIKLDCNHYNYYRIKWGKLILVLRESLQDSILWFSLNLQPCTHNIKVMTKGNWLIIYSPINPTLANSGWHSGKKPPTFWNQIVVKLRRKKKKKRGIGKYIVVHGSLVLSAVPVSELWRDLHCAESVVLWQLWFLVIDMMVWYMAYNDFMMVF